MNIYEHQRKKILNDYLRSPRCVRQKPSKPNNQFYSWKNRLNPDINNLCNRIRKLKTQNPIQECQPMNYQYYDVENSDQFKEKYIVSTDRYAISNQKVPNQIIKENRNCYSKVELIQNNLQKHRHSSSTFTGQKKNQRQMTVTAVPSIEIEGLSSRSQQPDSPQQHSFTDTTQSKFVGTFERAQKDYILWDDPKKQFKKTFKNSFSTTEIFQKAKGQLDSYHQQLREQERLYLLEKFMQHYEKIHNFKM